MRKGFGRVGVSVERREGRRGRSRYLSIREGSTKWSGKRESRREEWSEGCEKRKRRRRGRKGSLKRRNGKGMDEGANTKERREEENKKALNENYVHESH